MAPEIYKAGEVDFVVSAHAIHAVAFQDFLHISR